MRLATRRNGTRDGELVVVAADLQRCLSARPVVPHLQAALDDWARVAPQLLSLSRELSTDGAGEPLDEGQLGPPLPRAYEWLDGSAYLHHIELVRKARGAPLPATLRTEPLMYQGGSGVLLGPTDDVPLGNPAWGLDFEAELAVIVDDTPRGVSASRACDHVKLLLLVNDWTLRGLVPDELAKGFGFLVSKPATAFAPYALTPDELGAHYRDGRLHLPVRSYLNDRLLGQPHAGREMHFSFCELVAHAAQTRSLTAGTIIGSGTVSTRDEAEGVSCLAEQRTLEVLRDGAARTEFLRPGDEVRIEVSDPSGRNLFGSVRQRVVAG